VNPAASPTATVADEPDNTNSGVAGFTVNLNCCVALPDTFDAVTKYIVVDFTTEGLPDNCPVDVSNTMPVGVAEIKYVATPPVEITVNPRAVAPTTAISLDAVSEKAGFSITGSDDKWS
jgi:hypothetical protein